MTSYRLTTHPAGWQHFKSDSTPYSLMTLLQADNTSSSLTALLTVWWRSYRLTTLLHVWQHSLQSDDALTGWQHFFKSDSPPYSLMMLLQADNTSSSLTALLTIWWRSYRLTTLLQVWQHSLQSYDALTGWHHTLQSVDIPYRLTPHLTVCWHPLQADTTPYSLLTSPTGWHHTLQSVDIPYRLTTCPTGSGQSSQAVFKNLNQLKRAHTQTQLVLIIIVLCLERYGKVYQTSPMNTHTSEYACADVWKSKLTHAPQTHTTHSCVHIHTHTHTNAYIHTHTHTHTEFHVTPIHPLSERKLMIRRRWVLSMPLGKRIFTGSPWRRCK